MGHDELCVIAYDLIWLMAVWRTTERFHTYSLAPHTLI